MNGALAVYNAIQDRICLPKSAQAHGKGMQRAVLTLTPTADAAGVIVNHCLHTCLWHVHVICQKHSRRY